MLILYFITSKNIFHALFSFLFLVFVLILSSELFIISNIKNNLNDVNSNKLKISTEIVDKELSFKSTSLENAKNVTYILQDNSKLKINKNSLLKKPDKENKIIIKDVVYQYNYRDFLNKDAYKFMNKNLFHKKIYEVHYKK